METLIGIFITICSLITLAIVYVIIVETFKCKKEYETSKNKERKAN